MKLFQAVVAFTLAALLVVASGCSPSPTESVSRTPKPAATPTVSTPPTKDELLEQAQGVYRQIRAQTVRLQRAGGADSLPPELLHLVTGELESNLTAIFRHWKEAQIVSLGPDAEVVWIRPHDKVRDGSLVALGVCTDASKTRVRHGDGSVTTGGPVVNYYYFKYFDGVLKGFASGSDDVEGC